MFAKNEVWKRASSWAMSLMLLIAVWGVLCAHGQTGTAAISGTVRASDMNWLMTWLLGGVYFDAVKERRSRFFR